MGTVKSNKWTGHSVTSARVDLSIDNNATWMDAFQFGEPTDATWTLAGQSFEADVKPYDTIPVMSLNTSSGWIIIDDIYQRVIHFDVPADDIRDTLSPGYYVYDLVMIDGDQRRVPLMHGTLQVTQGVTAPD